jgi:hypothetical protein
MAQHQQSLLEHWTIACSQAHLTCSEQLLAAAELHGAIFSDPPLTTRASSRTAAIRQEPKQLCIIHRPYCCRRCCHCATTTSSSGTRSRRRICLLLLLLGSWDVWFLRLLFPWFAVLCQPCCHCCFIPLLLCCHALLYDLLLVLSLPALDGRQLGL